MSGPPIFGPVRLIDWRRRVAQVIEDHSGGRSRWTGGAPEQSRELSQAVREVLLGADPPVAMSRRAVSALERIRVEQGRRVDPSSLVLEHGSPTVLWSFAGTAANRTLAAALRRAGVEATGDADTVRAENLTVDQLRRLDGDDIAQAVPESVTADAVDGLKFSVALPQPLAIRTLAERGTDVPGAHGVAEAPVLQVQPAP